MTRRNPHRVNIKELDYIPAGLGIDGLISQRFLGWRKGNALLEQVGGTNTPYACWWHPPEGPATTAPPKLSEHMHLAWDVVEALFALGWKFAMTQNADKEVVIAFVPMEGEYDPDKVMKVKIPSVRLAPLGVCRAALLVADALYGQQEPDVDDEESSLVVM